MHNKIGQADGVHVLLTLFVIVLFLALGFVSYMLFKGKETNTSVYQADSKPFVQNPEYTSHFGCNNVRVEEFVDQQRNSERNIKNAVSYNSESNH